MISSPPHAEVPWTVTEEGELISDEVMMRWFTHPSGQQVLDKIHPNVPGTERGSDGNSGMRALMDCRFNFAEL